jgi:hypothetical protein
MGLLVIARDLEALEANVAALVAIQGSTDLANAITGTLSFDETAAGEQQLVEQSISVRTAIQGIWIDMVNATQNITLRVYHKIDGTNYRIFSEHSWLTTDDDGVFLEGFVAYRDIKVTLQCSGGGAGSVNIPYVVV